VNSPVKLILIVSGLIISGLTGWYFGKNHIKTNPVKLGDNVLAIVNGQSVSKSEFIAAMEKRGGLNKGQYQDINQRKQLLDLIVNQKIVLSKALDEGYAKNPVVQELYSKTVRDRYTKDKLHPQLLKVKVSKSEIMSHYENKKKSYSRPERRRGAIIFVEKYSSDDTELLTKKKNKISQALEEAKAQDENIKHFGELAKKYSDDKNSRYIGGVIGWLIKHPSRKYRWGDNVIRKLFALQNEGDLSDVLETQDGYYIVKLVGLEKSEEKPLTQLETGIKNKLLQDKRDAIRKSFMEEIVKNANIEINHDLLSKIEPLSEPGKLGDKKPPSVPGSGVSKNEK